MKKRLNNVNNLARELRSILPAPRVSRVIDCYLRMSYLKSMPMSIDNLYYMLQEFGIMGIDFVCTESSNDGHRVQICLSEFVKNADKIADIINKYFALRHDLTVKFHWDDPNLISKMLSQYDREQLVDVDVRFGGWEHNGANR